MEKAKAERRCIVTAEVLPQTELLRFALSPDGVIVPDVKGKLPGRGIWVTPKQAVLEEAIVKRRFAYSAKQKVTVPDTLVEQVSGLLRAQALVYLQRARLGGMLLHGFEKVASSLRSHEARVLIHAEDAAEDGARKLNALADNAKSLHFGTRNELSESLRIANPVHIVLIEKGISVAFIASYERWAGFVRKDQV